MSTLANRVAQSDDSEGIAIQQAIKKGLPIYLLSHVNGSTIDVSVDKAKMLKDKAEYIRTTPDGRFKIRLYERIHDQLRAI